jgi:hypothetical protein
MIIRSGACGPGFLLYGPALFFGLKPVPGPKRFRAKERNHQLCRFSGAGGLPGLGMN